MITTEGLKLEMENRPRGSFFPGAYRAKGYREGRHTTPSGRRADGIAALFVEPVPYIYRNDRIVGSIRPLMVELSEEEHSDVLRTAAPFGERHFGTNADHFSPDYETALRLGVPGLLREIDASMERHREEPQRLDFLNSMKITLLAFRDRLLAYADHGEGLLGTEGYDFGELQEIIKVCRTLGDNAPRTFREALQLVWMVHTAFLCEDRYAMALGRMDQYLYPFYQADVERGILTPEFALELLENTLVKITERRAYQGRDDVVNLCIGGCNRDGVCAVNDLSYLILTAVGNINLPGPNLSARITPDTPDEFLDACLKVIGTGLGYPALMNDEVNLAALRRYGYAEEDVRNYSMVGCIENFITGCQPPWSDGRFDTPRFINLVFAEDDLSEITTMSEFMARLEGKLATGVEEYVRHFNGYNIVADPENWTSPFLSCFCRDCIARGLDINMGGAKYPSVHGAALMGIGTTSDALAAIETVVFDAGEATLSELREAIAANFEGYEALREKLLAAPKYGNNHPVPDKYAVWFVDYLAGLFDGYKTYDGGGIYVAIAANTSNIRAGRGIGATPDGRLAGEPLSDAASPTYGRDTRGATSTILSVSKPDYTKVACGTVLNQKYSPAMFEDGKREKLLSLIRVYFAKGGQEIQINATSTEVLRDAMDHPEKYPTLVVRVSGFSAFYVTLDRSVQKDILARTQQG